MLHLARSLRLSGITGAVVLAAAAVVLSGCEVTAASDNAYRSGPVCPMIYNPVCAERRGQERTFPNACEARAQDWRIVATGECRSDDYGDYRRDRDDRNRDFRNRDGRDRDFRNRDDRDPDYRNRDGRNRDFRDNSRDRYDRRDFERPRFDNRPGRDPVIRPVTPDRPQPPVYQPPVIPNPPVQPVVPDGACPQVVDQVCGQVGSKGQWFINRCEMQRAGGVEAPNSVCYGGNR